MSAPEFQSAPSPDSHFLHALLHDLKGPISRVRMLAELVNRRAAGLDGEMQTLLTHMIDSTAAAERVLEGVSRYTRALDRPFRPQRFHLADAIDMARSHLAAQLEAAGATLDCRELPEITGDPLHLAALFTELIANSLRFRSEWPPAIEIAAHPAESGGWLVTIRDNGAGLEGIPPERLFRPFGKASESGGAGMGLAICSHVARLHGGNISAGPYRNGAEFQLVLPNKE